MKQSSTEELASKQDPLLTKRFSDTPDDARSMRFIYAILRKRRMVILVFTLATIVCLFCIPQVYVNYNLASYLPQEANSSQALEVMEEAYGTNIPNARLYVHDLSLVQASDLAQELRSIEGVSEVLWLGDQIDLLQPIEIADETSVAAWKLDDGYLFQLTIDADVAADTLNKVRSAAETTGAQGVALSGNIVTTVEAQGSTAAEIIYILLIAVAIVIIVISLTSRSWFEWVILLSVLAMAIIMNMGTNIFRGEISFITQICAAVLQLAVSMDYAIVMLHTFRRSQKEHPDDHIKAMAHAMRKGFSVVLSSAAVTFFGFLSLSVMSFLIGVDMGIVLAKGILFSFLCVMFLMPCMIIATYRLIKRFEHRSFVPSFDKFGLWCTRLMVPVSIVIVLIAIPSFIAQDKTTFTYGAEGFSQEGSQVTREADEINDAFGSAETWVMLVPSGQWSSEKALVNDLEALPKVSQVISYVTSVSERVPEEVVPEDQLEQLISDGYSRIIIQTTLDSNTDTDYDMVETVRSIGEAHFGDATLLAGTQVSQYDLKNITTDDSLKVKLFSIGTIALVLMLTFRSLSIPLIVIFPIVVSIWINLAVPYFAAQRINYIGFLVIDAVQLGAAVDYAIIYSREYLDQRKLYPPLKAARMAISQSAITIMTSAIMLTTAGLAIWLISSNGITSEIGLLIGRGAFIAMLMMFTLLPLLFVVGDWLIRHTTIGLTFYSSKKNTTNARLEKTMKAIRSFKYKGMRQKVVATAVCLIFVTGLLPAVAFAEGGTITSSGSSGTAAATTAEATTTSSPESGTSSAEANKTEVVYAKLTHAGGVAGLYVVNGFESASERTISDPGTYTSVVNLTTEESLQNTGGSTSFKAPEGAFYYKGVLPDGTLIPWDIALTYYLNDKQVDSEVLAGTSGLVRIELDIRANGSNPTFSDNYLLQISGSFASDSTRQITAQGGSVASAGSNEQVTFLMLPGASQIYTITIETEDFSFSGFTIAGVPISLAISAEDLGAEDLTEGLSTLKDSIALLDEGASSLQSGSLEIASGLKLLAQQNSTLIDGSQAIAGGIAQAASGAEALSQGSQQLVQELSNQATDASAAAQYHAALAQQNQQAYAVALQGTQGNLAGAGSALETALAAVSTGNQVEALAALNELSSYLTATGASVSDVSAAIGTEQAPGLVSNQAQATGYGATASTLQSVAYSYAPLDSGISELALGLPVLVENYSLLDEGISSYTSGVSLLSSSYTTFDEGVESLSSGAAALRDGTMTLDQDLIAAIEDELKQRLDPDFTLHSFVDADNTEVKSVQFVLLTDPIEPAQQEIETMEEQAEDTLWSRFLALFQ